MSQQRTGTRTPDFFLSSFETHLHTLTLTPTTIRNYLADVRAFARWHAQYAQRSARARMPLRPAVFRAYRQHLLRSNHSRATANRRLNTLRLYGRFLHTHGIITVALSDELARVPNPTRTNGTPPRVLSATQSETLRRTLHQHARANLLRRDVAIIELMLRAALRVNEIAHLQLDSLTLTNQGLCLNVGTNGHVRQVPIDQTLAQVLRDYLAVRPSLENNSSLFISQKGKSLSARAIQRLVEEYAHAANLHDVSANTLRHTCAQQLVNTRRDPQSVARWLGHKNTEALQRYKKHKE